MSNVMRCVRRLFEGYAEYALLELVAYDEETGESEVIYRADSDSRDEFVKITWTDKEEKISFFYTKDECFRDIVDSIKRGTKWEFFWFFDDFIEFLESTGNSDLVRFVREH